MTLQAKFFSLEKLRFSELYTLFVLAVLILGNIAFSWQVPMFAVNILIALTYGWFIFFINKVKYKSKYLELLSNIHYLLGILIIYSIYNSIIKSFGLPDADATLVKLDYWLLGKNAGDIFNNIKNPFFTEYFQISYTLFYFLPIIGSVDIYYRQSEEFDILLRNVLFAYFLSYLLYVVMPAIGPRFTIYSFEQIHSDLPGLLVTDLLRWVINFGGGVTNPNINPADIVNRDCMPSGHTMVSIVTMYYSIKFKSKNRVITSVIAISIIIATIYLRYHYLVDVLFGIVFAGISLVIEPKFHKFIVILKDKFLLKSNN